MDKTPIQVVRLDTTLGSITMQLFTKHAPVACDNFVSLVARGYYNGCQFFRVQADLFIQTGDPTNTGRGGQSANGNPFRDEINRDLFHLGPGVVSMANDGQNLNKSYFFITTRSAPQFDGKHTIFARVVSGLEVVEGIAKVPTDSTQRPRDAIAIVYAQVYRRVEYNLDTCVPGLTLIRFHEREWHEACGSDRVKSLLGIDSDTSSIFVDALSARTSTSLQLQSNYAIWVDPSLPQIIVKMRGNLENSWILLGSPRTLIQWTEETSPPNESVLEEGWRKRELESIEIMTFGMERYLSGAEIVVRSDDWKIVRVDYSAWKVHPVMFDDE